MPSKEGIFVSKQTVPKYAHLQYETLHELEISITEYWYLDMVYQLSRQGVCYKSLDNIAQDMRMTKNGVAKMRDRLTEKGLLIHRGNNRVSTSVKYNSVYFLDKPAYNSVTNRTTEYTSGVQLSIPKNNNKINIEKRSCNSVGTITSLQEAERRIARTAVPTPR